MKTQRKIRLLTKLLFGYVIFIILINALGLSGIDLSDKKTMGNIITLLVNIVLFAGIAYYLPRKRTKSTYWVSVVVIFFELLKKIGAIALIWRGANYASGLQSAEIFLLILTAIFTVLFVVIAALILQRDVHIYLTSHERNRT